MWSGPKAGNISWHSLTQQQCTRFMDKILHCAFFWQTEGMGLFSWQWDPEFPVSIEKFLRCSHLLENQPWILTKEAKSCLSDLDGLQLPCLPGIWKNPILLPGVLLSPLKNCWESKVELRAFPLKVLMLKKLGLPLINSVISVNDIPKRFFSWLPLLIVFSLHYQRYFLFPIKSPEVSFSPGWNKEPSDASGGFTWSLLICHTTRCVDVALEDVVEWWTWQSWTQGSLPT